MTRVVVQRAQFMMVVECVIDLVSHGHGPDQQ